MYKIIDTAYTPSGTYKWSRILFINIEDIENYMTDDAKNGTNGAYKYNNGNATYNTQTSTPYKTYKNIQQYMQKKT